MHTLPEVITMTRVSVGAGGVVGASSIPSAAAALVSTSVSLTARPCLRTPTPSPVTAPAARLPCAPAAPWTHIVRRLARSKRPAVLGDSASKEGLW